MPHLPRPQRKPAQHSAELAQQFRDRSVVEAYQHRPPYPREVFEILAALAVDEPRHVLDIGCGRGEIARGLAPLVARVDAVDMSAPMVQAGRDQPGGTHPHLRWVVGRAEDAPLGPPYALVTAGSSLHWMEWDAIMPRLADVLAPQGLLVHLELGTARANPWDQALRVLIPRYSTTTEYEVYDLLAELTSRGLFAPLGGHRTASTQFIQPIEDYVESLHSQNGLSRERLGAERAAAFDAEVRAAVTPHARHGRVTQHITCTMTWGRPLARSKARGR